MEILKLPVGIENFEDIRRSGFYYIDKTMFIEQFLNENQSEEFLACAELEDVVWKNSRHEHVALIF